MRHFRPLVPAVLAALVGACSAAEGPRPDLNAGGQLDDGNASEGESTCTPFADRTCQGGNLVHVDSCGEVGEVALECTGASQCDEARAACCVSETFGAGTAIRQLPGFSTASWESDATEGLLQTALANDRTDAIELDFQPGPSFELEIRAASTAIADYGTDDLRQIFVIVGHKPVAEGNGEFEAYGCGIEVVEGQAVTPKTSVVRLVSSGGTTSITALDRVDRAAVVENELFDVRVEAQDGVLSCIVTQDGNDVTVASASGLDLSGAVGLYTRETRARFTSLNGCGPF